MNKIYSVAPLRFVSYLTLLVNLCLMLNLIQINSLLIPYRLHRFFWLAINLPKKTMSFLFALRDIHILLAVVNPLLSLMFMEHLLMKTFILYRLGNYNIHPLIQYPLISYSMVPNLTMSFFLPHTIFSFFSLVMKVSRMSF